VTIRKIESGTIRFQTPASIVPAGFPIKPYESIQKRVVSRNTKGAIDPIVLGEFQGGWNAVAYRFCANVEHDASFTASVREYGVSPAMDQRYRQERELLGFFVTGLSVSESLAYSTYAIGSMLDATAFPMQTPKNRKNVDIAETSRRYKKSFPTENITVVWNELLHLTEFKELKEVRHILAHRCAPSRRIVDSASISFQTGALTDRTVQAEWTVFGIPIDENTTRTRHDWLIKTVVKILEATDKFTTSRDLNSSKQTRGWISSQ